jgi:hypothetical protein
VILSETLLLLHARRNDGRRGRRGANPPKILRDRLRSRWCYVEQNAIVATSSHRAVQLFRAHPHRAEIRIASRAALRNFPGRAARSRYNHRSPSRPASGHVQRGHDLLAGSGFGRWFPGRRGFDGRVIGRWPGRRHPCHPAGPPQPKPRRKRKPHWYQPGPRHPALYQQYRRPAQVNWTVSVRKSSSATSRTPNGAITPACE